MSLKEVSPERFVEEVIGTHWTCSASRPGEEHVVRTVERVKREPRRTRPFEPSGVAWFDDGSYATLDVMRNTDAWQHVEGGEACVRTRSGLGQRMPLRDAVQLAGHARAARRERGSLREHPVDVVTPP